jgi:hypothetical protein
MITNVLPRFVFLEVEPAKYMVLQQRVKGHVQELTQLINNGLDAGSRMPSAALFGTWSGLFGDGGKNHNEIAKRLLEFGCSTEQVVNSTLAFLVGSTVEMSLGMFFLFLLVEDRISAY